MKYSDEYRQYSIHSTPKKMSFLKVILLWNIPHNKQIWTSDITKQLKREYRKAALRYPNRKLMISTLQTRSGNQQVSVAQAVPFQVTAQKPIFCLLQLYAVGKKQVADVNYTGLSDKNEMNGPAYFVQLPEYLCISCFS